MADFKTHIGTSTVIGIGYGAAGYYYLNLPLPTCGLAAGLCSVAGMLPDLDSDSGVPVRETVSFAAAIVPMLMVDRFMSMGLSHESIALAGGIIYLVVRFGIGELFKRYTVHRGMWHSIPAAVSATLLAFLACSCEDINGRLFKASAVGIGFVTHLLLDELWSVSFKRFVPRLKKSSGTAFKLWGDNGWANFSTYAKLIVLIFLACGDPLLMRWLDYHEHGLPQFANKWVTELKQRTEELKNARFPMANNEELQNAQIPMTNDQELQNAQIPVANDQVWRNGQIPVANDQDWRNAQIPLTNDGIR